MLTAPERKRRLSIRTYQTNRTLILAGGAIARDHGLSLTLRAVKRPGAVATPVEGCWMIAAFGSRPPEPARSAFT